MPPGQRELVVIPRRRTVSVSTTAARCGSRRSCASTSSALAAHPRRRPLCLFSDGATALRCVAATRSGSDGATAALPLAPPGLALARASAALLAIHGAPTTLAKVAAHADVEGNHVADALAEIGAERRDDVLDVPAAFDARAPVVRASRRWRSSSATSRDTRSWSKRLGHRTAYAAAAAPEGSLNALNRCLSL